MPIGVPTGVVVVKTGNLVSVVGPNGRLETMIHSTVDVKIDGESVTCLPRERNSNGWSQAGTARSLVANMMKGVCDGFVKEMRLVGVGYRAQLQGNVLNMTLGFSHQVSYICPRDVSIETPAPTRIVVRGMDKQRVGQVAAEIRAYRPPEPYKGKGVRYIDEDVSRKEAKKKQKQ